MTGFSENMRGAMLMIAAMVAFTLNDAFMKAALQTLPFFQTLLLRSLLTLAMLVPLARLLGGLRLRLPPREARIVAIRTLAEVGAAYFFITAITRMPLANATAILQALPLTVALAAMLFLGERLGWRRLTAILVGFAGVMLIVRPGVDGFDIHALWALAAVVCVTLRDLVTRRLAGEVSSLTVSVWAAAGVAVFAGLGSLTEVWAPVPAREAGLVLAATVAITAAYMLGVAAMRVGEIGFVAPFRYAGLLCALAIGVFVFGEIPDLAMILGSIIVVGTGIYTFYRERRVARISSLDTPHPGAYSAPVRRKG